MFKLNRLSAGLAIAFGGSLLIGAAPSLAQDTAQRVEVTGSNIKRVDKEGTSPVLTITSKEIEQSGARTVLQLLQQVTSFGSGGYNDTSDQNSFSRGVATASLRNFGSTSTLILINGRRLTPSAYANPNNGQSTLYDLNSLPVSALERVEILKDGASAVYGSDAIAGVINFITRSDYKGGRLSASMGANDDKQFASQNVNAAIGFGDFAKDRYNVLVTFDATNRGLTKQREGSSDIMADEYRDMAFRLNPYFSYASNQAFVFRERSPNTRSFVTSGSATSPDILNKTDCDPSRKIVGSAANGIGATSFLFGRTFCNYDGWEYNDAQNKGTDLSTMAVAKFALTPNITAFGEVALNESKRVYRTQARTLNGTAPTTNFLVGGIAPSFQPILPVGHPDNPFPTSRAAVIYRFENLKTGTDLKNVNTRALGGLRGTAGDWDWETAFLWNESKRTQTEYGFLYLPVLNELMTKNRSLASLAADPNVTKDLNNIGKAGILHWDAKATTEFGSLPGGKMALAAGLELREERLKIDPDPLNATGQILGLATTAIDAKRQVSSAFLELRAPFTKSFEMDFAGRVDKYPSFKTNFVPKVGAKWTIRDGLALRGSYSEGFRAPALSQVALGGAQFFTTVVDPVRCPDGLNPVPGASTTDCAKSVSGVGGNNPDLKPETSRGFTLGLIFSPTKDTDVVVDAYTVKQKNEVALGSADFLLRNPQNFPANYITRDTNPLNQLTDAKGNPIAGTGPLIAVALPWTNQGSTAVTGVDIDLRNRTNLGEVGNLTSSLKWTHLMNYDRAERPGDVTHNAVGSYGGLQDWATSAGSISRDRMSITLALEKGPHTFVGTMRYISSISLVRRFDGPTVYAQPYCHYGTGQPAGAYSLGGLPAYNQYYPDCKVPSWETFDVGYTYSGIKNLRIGFSISNLLDTPAPFFPGYTTLGYNSSLHNGYGRYYRVSASYDFK